MDYKWAVLTVTTVGVFMAGLDTSILVVGLPQMAASLHADAEQAIWFTQGYVLASTAMLLLMGRVSDIFGRTRLFKAGLVIFTLGSFLTSLSQDPMQVILFRIFQGTGTSILWASGVAMIIDATPTKELGFSLGLNQIAVSIGSALGLTISGVILLLADWRFLFYLNIPVGVFGLVWARGRLREIATLESGATVDWAGFALFFTSLVSLLLSLTYAAYGSSERNLVYPLLVLSVASMAVFIFREGRTKHPLLDFDLLRIPQYAACVSGTILVVMAWSGVLLLLSFYFQLLRDLTPFEAGVSLLPVGISMGLSSPFAGRLSDRLGKMRFIIGGLMGASLAMFMFSTMDLDTAYLWIVAFMIVFGASMSFFIAPSTSWGMMSVPPRRRGVAASFRETGWSIGQTMSLNLVVWIMSLVIPYRIITSVVSAGKGSLVSLSDKLAFMSGLHVAFLVLGVTMASALVPTMMGWRKAKRTATVAPREGAD